MNETISSNTDAQNETIQYLIVEAAKYRGKTAGEALPVAEVEEQAADNGYSSDAIDALLDQAGLASEQEVIIPEQGDILGSMWTDGIGDTPESTATQAFEKRQSTTKTNWEPEPLDEDGEDPYRLREPIADTTAAVADNRYLQDGQPMTAFSAVGSYIKRRHGENVSAQKHGFRKTRHWRAKRRYAKGKDMDRQLLSDYEFPTTALFSLRVSPGDRSRLTLLTGMEEAFDATLKKLRYRLQTAPDAPFAADEWQYYAVIAGTDTRATPHMHIMVYCDGGIHRTELNPVVEKFVEKCPFAPDSMKGNKPEDGAVIVRGYGHEDIPRMDDNPAESAGGTYVLGQLPHLQAVDSMALDELLHSSTVDAWQKHSFRRSDYTVWDDGEEPTPSEISEEAPAQSPDGLAALM